MAEVYKSNSEDQGGQRSGYLRGEQTGEEEEKREHVLQEDEEHQKVGAIARGWGLCKMAWCGVHVGVYRIWVWSKSGLMCSSIMFSLPRQAILNLLEPITDESKGDVSFTAKLVV